MKSKLLIPSPIGDRSPQHATSRPASPVRQQSADRMPEYATTPPASPVRQQSPVITPEHVTPPASPVKQQSADTSPQHVTPPPDSPVWQPSVNASPEHLTPPPGSPVRQPSSLETNGGLPSNGATPTTSNIVENNAKKPTNSQHSERSNENGNTEKYNLRARSKKTEKSQDFSDHSDNNSVKDTNETDNAGQLKVTEHGLRRHTKKRRSFKCEHCQETFGLIKELNKHYGQSHPDHKFKCDQCTKTYASRNALIRHERSHDGMEFSCDTCAYTCMFSYELKNHVKKHTQTGLYLCTFRGCTKTFTTKKGMVQHTQVHDDTTYKCDICGKADFNTKGYLHQHLKRHKEGFVSRCGHSSKGPTARQVHQKNCDQCKLLLSEKKKRRLYDTDSEESSSEENTATDSSSSSTSTGTSGEDGAAGSSSDSVVDATDSESESED